MTAETPRELVARLREMANEAERESPAWADGFRDAAAEVERALSLPDADTEEAVG